MSHLSVSRSEALGADASLVPQKIKARAPYRATRYAKLTWSVEQGVEVE